MATLLWRVESKTRAISWPADRRCIRRSQAFRYAMEILLSLTDQNGTKAVTMMKDPNQSGTLGGSAFFREMRAQHSLRLLPDATIEGKVCM